MTVVTLQIKAKDVVLVTRQYRGARGGRCIACGASGLLHNLGYPHRVKIFLGLRHKKGCSLNKYLADDGSIKKRRRTNGVHKKRPSRK